jgi:DNA-binding transcriptional MerR regulator
MYSAQEVGKAAHCSREVVNIAAEKGLIPTAAFDEHGNRYFSYQVLRWFNPTALGLVDMHVAEWGHNRPQ